MYEQVEKPKENKSRDVANSVNQKKSFGFVDNRFEAVAQRKLQKLANNSPQLRQTAQLQKADNHSSSNQPKPIQMMLRRAFSAPAATTKLGSGSNYRADSRTLEVLNRQGGMKPQTKAETIPWYRVPLYVLFSSTNPGVISTAKSQQAAIDFATAEKTRKKDDSDWYIYQINTEGLQAIDREKALPKWFRSVWKAEDEEMIKDNIPMDKLKQVDKVSFVNEPDHKG